MKKSIDSLRKAITTSARDYSTDKRDAWIYGIVIGWGDAIWDVAKLHKWPASEVIRLKSLHSEFQKI